MQETKTHVLENITISLLQKILPEWNDGKSKKSPDNLQQYHLFTIVKPTEDIVYFFKI